MIQKDTTGFIILISNNNNTDNNDNDFFMDSREVPKIKGVLGVFMSVCIVCIVSQ